MTDTLDGTAAVDRASGRRGRWWAAAAAVALLAAGIGWWAVRGTEQGTVAVPSTVCDGSLPGSLAAAVLPAEGAAYTEEVREFSRPGAESGYCFLRAGGVSVQVKFDLSAGGTFTRATIEKQAHAKGRSPLSADGAEGYVGDRSGALFAPCPHDGDKDAIAWVTAGYVQADDDVAGSQRDGFRDLTIAAARHAAQDVLGCTGTGKQGGGS
ncbi:hypothetical protein [Actinacidiphila glaucinigra]|uniref:hypothetical protein n=1 Tax=Actinacidiphila glaucinigra TaxID=235986 RepID=UPI0035E22B87